MNSDHISPGDFISPAMFAAMIGVTPRVLCTWARKGHGPRRIAFGPKCHRYLATEVRAWIETRAKQSA